MANRFGNQYRIAIGTETSYGSGFTQMSGEPAVGSVAWTDLLVHSGVINMTPVINTAPTTYKSGLTVTHPCEEVQTTSMGNVTVSGDASLDILEKYIGGVMLELVSGVGILEFPANTADIPSFVLYQIWDDAPSEATKFKVNRVKGAKLQQLVITGAQGGLIQFEATFETQTVEREVEQDITGNDPGRSCGTALQFGEMTASLAMGNEATALDTFSITLTNEFTADASKFANNMTLFNPHIIKQGGEISYTCNYDSAGAEINLSIISDPNTINSDTIWINSESNCFQVIITSIATSLDLPDVERDYFKLNYTGRIISDGASNVPQVFINY